MKSIIIALLVAWGLTGKSQKNNIDSLEKLIKHHVQKDTVLLSMLAKLSFYYQEVDIERGIKIADSAIALGNHIQNSQKYIAALYISKGINYWTKSENVSALQCYTRAEKIFTSLNDERGRADVHANMANTYIEMGRFDTAKVYLEDLIQHFIKINDKEKEIATYNNLGVVYQYLFDLAKAQEYFNKVRLHYEKTNNQLGIASALTNIAIIKSSYEQYSSSLEYYKRAFDIYRKIGSDQGLADTKVSIAGIYYQLGDSVKALANYQEALVLSLRINKRFTIAVCYTNMAELYSFMYDYEKAFEYIQKGLKYSTDILSNQIVCYNILAKLIFKAPNAVLIQNGIRPSERFSKAILNAQTSLNLAQQAGTIDNQYYAWENLSNIYEAQGKSQKALNAYKQFTKLKDSAFESKKIKKLTENEMLYKYEKDSLQAQANFENQFQVKSAKETNIRIVIITVFLVSIVFGVYHLISKEKQHQRAIAQEEMQKLRAQVQPHFIFNALNSIKGYVGDSGSREEMRIYIDKFSALIRLILKASSVKLISLYQDVHMLELYLQLEQIRTGSKFEYEVNIIPEINQLRTLVPPMLLQPLVENSIWHGFNSIHSGGEMKLTVKLLADVLIFIVKDNGIGRATAYQLQTTAPKKSPHDSKGLEITKRRIALLNKEHSIQSAISISDLNPGTMVTIKIPYQISTDDQDSSG